MKKPLTCAEAGRKGGRAGTGAAKARTPEQARKGGLATAGIPKNYSAAELARRSRLMSKLNAARKKTNEHKSK